VVAGAYENVDGLRNAGSAYVFDLAGASPATPLVKLTAPAPSSVDNFGGSVAIDGCSIAVGAPRDDIVAPDQGAAYLFTVGPTLCISPAAPGLATLSWTPAPSFSFVLQYAETLAPTNWLNAPSGETNPVTISSTNAARFYRLFQP